MRSIVAPRRVGSSNGDVMPLRSLAFTGIESDLKKEMHSASLHSMIRYTIKLFYVNEGAPVTVRY